MPSKHITLRHVLAISGGLASRARTASIASRSIAPPWAWKPASAPPQIHAIRCQHDASHAADAEARDEQTKTAEAKRPLTPAEVFPDLLGGENAKRPPSLTPSSSDIWDAAIDASKSLPYALKGSRGAPSWVEKPTPSSTTSGSPSAAALANNRSNAQSPSGASRDRLSKREQSAFEDLLEAMFKPHALGTDTMQRWDKIDRRRGSEPRPMRPPSFHSSRDGEMMAGSYVKPSVATPVSQLGDDVYEAFEGLKETIASLPTDREILAWATENVFKPHATSRADDVLGSFRYPATYPLVLAHLIGLFRDTFHSPYAALALFAHARDLSAESYVAGCSTGVYNEAIRTRWESLHDLEGVEALVEEMAARGVGWDRHTLRLVSGVVAEVTEKMMSGDISAAPGATRTPVDGPTLARLAYGRRALEALPALERRVEIEVEAEERRHRAQMRRRLDEMADMHGHSREIEWS